MSKLKDVVPQEFFIEYMDTRAAKYLEIDVVRKVDGREEPWPGKEKNVMVYWELENGKLVGWNENPSRGWSFPVIPVIGKKCPNCKSELKKKYQETCKECGWMSNKIKKHFSVLNYNMGVAND